MRLFLFYLCFNFLHNSILSTKLMNAVETENCEEEDQEDSTSIGSYEDSLSRITNGVNNVYVGPKETEVEKSPVSCFSYLLNSFKVKKCSDKDKQTFLENIMHSQLKPIARGADGEVFKMTRPSDGKIVAVKKKHKKNCQARKDFRLEVQLMWDIRNEGITAPLDCIFEDRAGYLYYMMDYLEGKSLDEVDFYHPQSDNFNLKWGELCSKMAIIMTKLHKKRVMHLDIHLDNWIVSPDGRLYIIDFSRARKTSFFPKFSPDSRPNGVTDALLLGRRFEEIADKMSLILATFLGIPGNSEDLLEIKRRIPRDRVDFNGIQRIVHHLKQSPPNHFMAAIQDASSALKVFMQDHV